MITNIDWYFVNQQVSGEDCITTPVSLNHSILLIKKNHFYDYGICRILIFLN